MAPNTLDAAKAKALLMERNQTNRSNEVGLARQQSNVADRSVVTVSARLGKKLSHVKSCKKCRLVSTTDNENVRIAEIERDIIRFSPSLISCKQMNILNNKK